MDTDNKPFSPTSQTDECGLNMRSLDRIAALLAEGLPGKTAQAEMCPALMRPVLMKGTPPQAVNSAVNLLLRPAGGGASFSELLEWRVLLIRRNTYYGVHSGQIALPGGKCEPGETYWQTACRETFEEVGVTEDCLSRLGELTSVYVLPSNYVIHPFVCIVRCSDALEVNPREVADYKFVPLAELDPARSRMHDFSYPDGSVKASPAWLYQDYVIWGATAMILSEFYRVLAAGG